MKKHGDGGVVIPLPSNRGRAPFTPHTGNPENDNYFDWIEHLLSPEGGNVVSLDTTEEK